MVDTEAVSSNNELVNIVVDPGLGYVNGFKVELLSPLSDTIQRGTSVHS